MRFSYGSLLLSRLANEDRAVFEVLMDASRNFSMASSSATNPIVFEPMVIYGAFSTKKDSWA